MFVRDNQNQFRISNADVQQYYGANGTTSKFAWNKPVGTTFVYILLVGAGGVGDGATQGGGTGAVSTWIGPAKSIPNSLAVQIESGQTLLIGNSGGSFVTMMSAAASTGTAAGTVASVNGYFAAGMYGFTAGVAGVTTASTAQTATFLNPGGAASPSVGNYGYTVNTRTGMFQLSPIINAVAPSNFTANVTTAYGCGSYVNGTIGGPGMAVIASW